MAITGPGITFNPLYWVHHDQWRYHYTQVDQQGNVSTRRYNHYGHTHLFMLGFDANGSSGDAWGGRQEYTFTLKDIWGPRSDDPNQQKQYRVVGLPKWYFHVEEIWRRIYIQPWDAKVETDIDTQRRGVRYDCCAQDKISGPFREGSANAPIFPMHARTLPLDYYTSNEKLQTPGHRTNHLKDLADIYYTQDHPELAPAWNPESYDPRVFDLQHDNDLYAGGNTGEVIEPAAKPPFADPLYIYPLVEYQKVVQLNDERWPGAEAGNDVDAGEEGEQTGEQFGDGWSFTTSIPFTDPDTGAYRSPFCPPGTKEVKPVGQYFNTRQEPSTGLQVPLVTPENKPRYPKVEYTAVDADPMPDEPYFFDHPDKMPPQKSEQPMGFNNPYGDQADGRWVQQCMGGVIKARAKIIIEHKMGGRETVWVTATQYLPATAFAGTEQGRE